MEVTDSQESTQPADCMSQTDSGFEESQTQTQPDYWGRLYPLKSSLQKVDLINSSVSVGKANTDIVLTKNHLPKETLAKCSKLHFEIQRKQINIMGAYTTQVLLTDKSSNGTFINRRILKKKKSGSECYKILNTNDIIGFPGCKEAYVFINSMFCTSNAVPYTVRKKYQLSLRLGAGAFGEVYLAFERDTGVPRAMKTVVKDIFANSNAVNSFKRKLLNEIDILQTVKHPNVIELVDAMDCKRDHFLFLEFMEGKDLETRIKDAGKLDESISRLYFYQISKGVEYLHQMGIIHRDLKPANILLASCEMETLLKITDFGLSKVLSSTTMLKTQCGTKLYVAPEVLSGGGLYEYTELVDVWSMGVLLYVCLSGREPFDPEIGNLEELIKDATFSMPPSEWQDISEDVKLLIKKMLTKNPDKRIKIKEILVSDWMQDEVMLEKIEELYSLYDRSSNTLSETMVSNGNSTLTNTMDIQNLSAANETISPPAKKRRTI